MGTRNSKVNEISKTSTNSKKDFRELIKGMKEELHKLGFVSSVIATNCSIGFFESVAEGKKIVLSERTKQRLIEITKNKESVKKAVIGYFPRIISPDGVVTLVTLRTYEVDDKFNPQNNTKNSKNLEKAIRFTTGSKVLQVGYTEKEYKFDPKDSEIIFIKSAKSSNDGNIVLTTKVFHKKERFSIDEAAMACIAYAQSDVELILD